MPDTIRDIIAVTPIVDVHEHHMAATLLNPKVNLLSLFRQSYAGWTQARPYPLPSESREGDPMLEATPDTTWDALSPYLEHSSSNFFVRNLCRGICELYHVRESGITRFNWEHLDAEIRAHHQRPDWCREVLKRAHLEKIITDPYDAPTSDVRPALGETYHSVLRINAFACGWNKASRDHNGHNAHDLLAQHNLKADSWDEYLSALTHLVDGMPARHQVALKNALAYDRDLHFGSPDHTLARQAWGQPNPGAAERKAFSDAVVDHFCRLAGERDIPVQMHLGSAIIQGSHPLHVAPLIERHPRTRFLLMHFAYPWSRDLLGMAFVYRNIWLDLTWSYLLSPTHFKAALHEAIEILPDEGRMMLGGDNWHVEETFGTMISARQLLGDVLKDKLVAGYFHLDDAERLARRILRENALHFFKLM